MAAATATSSRGLEVTIFHLALLLLFSLAFEPVKGDKEFCAETCRRTSEPVLCMNSIAPTSFQTIQTLFDLQSYMISVGKTKSATLSETYVNMQKDVRYKGDIERVSGITACMNLFQNSGQAYDLALGAVKAGNYPAAKVQVSQVVGNAQECQSKLADDRLPVFPLTVDVIKVSILNQDLLNLS